MTDEEVEKIQRAFETLLEKDPTNEERNAIKVFLDSFEDTGEDFIEQVADRKRFLNKWFM